MGGILIYCFFMYLLGGLGASLGYHRILTHRAAEMPKWLEYGFVLLGLPAGTPIQWAGSHRAHHLHTDQEGDPHSPIVDGFWYAHCGWYIQSKNRFLCLLYALAGPLRMMVDSIMRPRTNQEHVYLAKDIQAKKFYAIVSQPLVYAIIMWVYLTTVLIVPYILFSWVGVLAASITLVVIYNMGDAVDSFGHLFGKKKGNNESRNNLFLGVFAFGDGWHANHHHQPHRAKHGVKRNQPDLSYLVLRTGKLIGIIKKIY